MKCSYIIDMPLCFAQRLLFAHALQPGRKLLFAGSNASLKTRQSTHGPPSSHGAVADDDGAGVNVDDMKLLVLMTPWPMLQFIPMILMSPSASLPSPTTSSTASSTPAASYIYNYIININTSIIISVKITTFIIINLTLVVSTNDLKITQGTRPGTRRFPSTTNLQIT